MRGQLSLEYLVLSLVALSLIAVSIAALSVIRENSLHSFSLIEFRHDADTVASSVSEACALGEGNYVSADIFVPLSVSYYDGKMTVSSGEYSESYEVPCAVGDDEIGAGSVSVGVEGGVVFFG